MDFYQPYSVFPLGDEALIIDFGNKIDEEINKKVLHLFHRLKKTSHLHITDLIPAYSSLTVYYDVIAVYQKKEPEKTAFETIVEWIEELNKTEEPILQETNRLIEVPVCYTETFATDIHYMAQQKNIDVEEIIHLHTSKTYRVFMMGFLPGFAYMGEVDEKISVPRKPQPQNVVAGAVGIAGKQTGIYPLDCPGGWQIIGRTPIRLFNRESENPVLFETGDAIKFYTITEDEFKDYQSRNS
jgi:inhibitor of KinA